MPAPSPTLLVTAAPAESRAVAGALGVRPPAADWSPVPAGPGIHLVQSGVGKVNAAAAVLLALPLVRPASVVNLGICGSLPGPAPAPLGAVVLATASVYADEGVQTPDAFLTLDALGFPLGGASFSGSGVAGDGPLLARLAQGLPGHVVGAVATVSTCSGTDALAAAVAARTGGVAEAMEGAAIAHALARLPAPRPAFAEVRVVSNTTGDRASQRWEMKAALARLGEVARAVAEAARA